MKVVKEGIEDERDVSDLEREPSDAFKRFVSQKRGEEAAAAASNEIHNGLKRGDKVKVNSEAAKALKINPNETFTIASFKTNRPGSLLQSIDVELANKAGQNVGSVNIEYVYEAGSETPKVDTGSVPSTIFSRNAGISQKLKSLSKDDLMEMIREELAEALGIYGGDGVTDVNGHQLDEFNMDQFSFGSNPLQSQPKASFEGKWTDIKDKEEFIKKFNISSSSPLQNIVSRAIGSSRNYAITNEDGKFYVYIFTQTANPGKPSQPFNSLEDAKKSVKEIK
jgi:hypothetical protein